MNLNKVFIIGRLTQDPEIRSTASGQSVGTLRLATNRVWTDQSSGQKQEATEYHSVVVWGRLADVAGKYLKRGGLVMIEGRLQTRSWDDKTTGAKRYMTEIVAEGLQLGPRPASAGLSGQGEGFDNSQNRPVVDVKRAPVAPVAARVAESEIPIIDENELTRQGVEEGEVSIKDVDLPF